MVITITEIKRLVKERKVVFEAGGGKRVLSGELKEGDMWETLERGCFVTQKELRDRHTDNKQKYTLPFYYLHQVSRASVRLHLLLGFYVSGNLIRVRHFSPCSAEVNFYRELITKHVP